MSNLVRPHRQQPTRLLCPWDSPGKNTGVGCHFLLQCMKVKSESEVTQSCPTLRDPMDCSLPGSSVPGIFQARVLEWVASAFSHLMLRQCLRCVCVFFFFPLRRDQNYILKKLCIVIIWFLKCSEYPHKTSLNKLKFKAKRTRRKSSLIYKYFSSDSKSLNYRCERR